MEFCTISGEWNCRGLGENRDSVRSVFRMVRCMRVTRVPNFRGLGRLCVLGDNDVIVFIFINDVGNSNSDVDCDLQKKHFFSMYFQNRFDRETSRDICLDHAVDDETSFFFFNLLMLKIIFFSLINSKIIYFKRYRSDICICRHVLQKCVAEGGEKELLR